MRHAKAQKKSDSTAATGKKAMGEVRFPAAPPDLRQVSGLVGRFPTIPAVRHIDPGSADSGWKA
jgi:hypothetical protein